MGSSNDGHFINAYQSGKNRDLTEFKAGAHLALRKCLLARPASHFRGNHLVAVKQDWLADVGGIFGLPHVS